jgi:hypothetical protein
MLKFTVFERKDPMVKVEVRSHYQVPGCTSGPGTLLGVLVLHEEEWALLAGVLHKGCAHSVVSVSADRPPQGLGVRALVDSVELYCSDEKGWLDMTEDTLAAMGLEPVADPAAGEGDGADETVVASDEFPEPPDDPNDPSLDARDFDEWRQNWRAN